MLSLSKRHFFYSPLKTCYVLAQNNNILSENAAMHLLNGVGQAENPTEVTSHTQWSVGMISLSARLRTA